MAEQVKFVRKIGKVAKVSYMTTIPKELIKYLDIDEGSLIEMSVASSNDKKVVVIEKASNNNVTQG